jgi:hypothetical protein
VNEGNADLAEKRDAPWYSVGTLPFDLEPLVAADVWRVEGEETYKMRALLLIILPGKRD